MITLFLPAPHNNPPSKTSPRTLPVSAVRHTTIAEAYGKLPLRFEANHGQTDDAVQFLSRGSGYSLFLTPTESVLSLNASHPCVSPATCAQSKARQDSHPNQLSVVRMKLIGANRAPRAEGFQQLPGTSNYFIGNDPKRWRTGVPNFARVRFGSVYPGVDLIYYGNQRQLEYDFIVKPGADPANIKLGFTGVKHVQIDSQGDLLLQVNGREVSWRKPVVYQEVDGHRDTIAAHYVQNQNNTVTFALAPCDSHHPLIIDPQLVYATFLGGTSSDTGFDIAADADGNAYITGLTASTDFPTEKPLQDKLASTGSANAFITKLSAEGDGLIYSTYLGGSGGGALSEGDWGSGIAIDSTGNAYITGFTFSNDFPTTAGAFQPNAPGSGVSFVTKLSAAGDKLLYSTYLGGSNSGGFLTAPKIAIDADGNAYVAGTTYADDYPTINSTYSGAGDCTISKLNPIGSGLLFSTYLGGKGQDECNSIAVGAFGNAYVTGVTLSDDFPFTLSVGKGSGFVVKFNNSGNGMIFSTQLGGTSGNHGDAGGGAVAIDADSNIYLAGTTTATDFPVTLNAFQQTFGGGNTDGYVMKLDSAGANILIATYLGGDFGEGCAAITLDPSGKIFVTGSTNSDDFPVTGDALQKGFSGGVADVFVAELDPGSVGTGTLVYSTYMGGSVTENAFGIATDSSGNVYVVGNTSSSDFPHSQHALQTSFAGGANDGFVAKFAGSGGGSGQPANINATSGSSQGAIVGAQASASMSATVTDSNGHGVSGQSVTFTAPSSGASGTFAGGSSTTQATTDSNGVATAAAFTANSTPGSYTVSATVAGVGGSASFTLTNVDFSLAQATAGTVQITAGSSATAALNLTTAPNGAALPVDVNYSCDVQTSMTGVTCSLSPTKTAAGSTSGSSTLAITTTAAQAAASDQGSSLIRLAILLAPGIFGIFLIAGRKVMSGHPRVILTCVGIAALWITLAGCSNSTTPKPPNTGSGTVTVTSTAGTISKPMTINFTVQ